MCPCMCPVFTGPVIIIKMMIVIVKQTVSKDKTSVIYMCSFFRASQNENIKLSNQLYIYIYI